MDINTTAMIIQEGSKIITAVIRSRPYHPKLEKHEAESISREIVEAHVQPIKEQQAEVKEKAGSVKSGCIPCALGHFGTCSNLLNEAVRFSKDSGMDDEVIDRINLCLDELNSMERKDLRPEMIISLVGWEKELADKSLEVSRTTRHKLEAITNAKELEEVAASTQTVRRAIGRVWFQNKIAEMSPEKRAKLEQTLKEKAKQQTEAESAGTEGQAEEE